MLSSLVNLGFSLVAMFIVMIVTRTPFHATLLLMPIPIFYTFLLSVGLGTMLAALTVYFRDIAHFYGVFILAWTYFTPIFYSGGYPAGFCAQADAV
ncbi:MAG: ABC transporter permease [Oscillospiraceae bacterium]